MTNCLIKIAVIFVLLLSKSYAYVENNKAFGEWLVSCKLQNSTDLKGDCFLGTQFEDDLGGGAIIFTKYYLAFSHNELLLSDGVVLTVDNHDPVESSMNTGISSFFKQIDRKSLSVQMSKGQKLLINVTNQLKTNVSLNGFADAYKYYIERTN
jgi:invasion protein IalB